ncbi:hypothetical protein LCGC14_2358330, partial [marine sediment metagenome]
PLDGALSDKLSGEPVPRRIRPVTLEYASAHFPKIIIRLKQGRLHVHMAKAVQDKEVILLRSRDPAARHERWFILKSDFDIVKSIAADINIRSSPYEGLRRVEDRIRARVEAAFSGRGVPI